MRIGRVELSDGSVATGVIGDERITLVGPDDPAFLIELLNDPQRPVDGDEIEAAGARLLAPIERPPSVRDFMIFEEHVANARQRTGRDVPDAWYQAPAFYFSNPAGIQGPDTDVRRPKGSRALDLELEVAAIIGTEVQDIDADDPRALDAIAGFVLMNDWSARDLQMGEMKVGLGPVKGKDFATSIGPWIVTKDELGTVTDGRWSCRVDAYVADRHVGGADIATAHFGWNQVVARASENTRLVPGDILGSGTVGTGCLIELRELGKRDENPWLRDGDVVELRGGPLGTLRNTIVGSDAAGGGRSHAVRAR
ncbi:fumarylacetoacetate hydrolase family protein [Agrococcus baldri]|uniref:Fumarylacetoacetase n=1 Tax=Agrococcus baldri TaxID=153730 RepID=A0AA87UW49_9MICO|nr:fumarylacetoacetate hydrolase family protein [Agrococcus baldri]GEK79127.1 fumarylacetoacetase [Agrococcus baldri]